MRFHPGYYAKETLKANGIPEGQAPEFLGLSKEETEALFDYRLTVTEETAEKLSAAFGTSKGLWLNLQKRWDEEEAGKKRRKKAKATPVRNWIAKLSTVDAVGLIFVFVNAAASLGAVALAFLSPQSLGMYSCVILPSMVAAFVAGIPVACGPSSLESEMADTVFLLSSLAVILAYVWA